jgi:hypothetical protein
MIPPAELHVFPRPCWLRRTEQLEPALGCLAPFNVGACLMKVTAEIPDVIFRRAQTGAAERRFLSSARPGGAVGQAPRPRR